MSRALIDHMKGGATNTVQNAAGEVERRVSKPPPAGGRRRRPLGEGAPALHSEPALCRADDRGRDRLRRGARASTVSRAPTASDLVQIALAALRPGAAPAEPRPAGGFSRSAVPPARRPCVHRGGASAAASAHSGFPPSPCSAPLARCSWCPPSSVRSDSPRSLSSGAPGISTRPRLRQARLRTSARTRCLRVGCGSSGSAPSSLLVAVLLAGGFLVWEK